MIVTDASVLTNAFTDDGPIGVRARAELSNDPHWVAPVHLAVEVFSAIRGRWLGHKIGQQRAEEALTALTTARIDLVPAVDLIARMWQLRANTTGYDAAYIATAEAFGCSLVTADRRLASVPGVSCTIVLAVDSS